MEPFMAISSYCRNCGEYFRILKGVPVVKPGPRISGINEVLRSGQTPAQNDEPDSGNALGDVEATGDVEENANATVNAWLRSSGTQSHGAQALTASGVGGETPNGEGAFFGLVEASEETKQETSASKSATNKTARKKSSKKKSPRKKAGLTAKQKADQDHGEPEIDESLGKEAQSKNTLGHGSMEALIGDLSERSEFGADDSKMPANYVLPDKQVKKPGKSGEIEVRCFRCNHLQSVTRYATSTQCGRCSAYITMADYEIKGVRNSVLRTRGDVIISRRGSLIDTELACHNLTAYGLVNARIDCTGTVVFKHSGVVKGPVYCRRLVVGKKCELEFPDGVIAENVEVYGVVRGNTSSRDKITVYKSGRVEGDVQADQVEVRDGGTVSGEISSGVDVDVHPSLKAGYNPSIID